MLRTLRKSFVLTVAAMSATACQKQPDPIHAENPPPPKTKPSTEPTETTTATATATSDPPSKIATRKRKRTSDATATWKTPTGATPWPDLVDKNPKDADGRTIYVSNDDSCFVEVPIKTPPKTPLPSGSRYVDDVPLDCPAALDDPAWDECSWGTLLAHKTKPECYCTSLGGNPPPPPRLVACPKK